MATLPRPDVNAPYSEWRSYIESFTGYSGKKLTEATRTALAGARAGGRGSGDGGLTQEQEDWWSDRDQAKNPLPPGKEWYKDPETGEYTLVDIGTTPGDETTPGNDNYQPVVTDAYSYLNALLKTALGVDGFGTWAYDYYTKGASVTEIIQALRYGLDTSEAGQAAHQQYLAAFPGMDKFLQDGTFSGESPELQYIAYRNSVKEAASRYGINDMLVSPEKIKSYLENKVSAAEIAERMSTAASAVATTPTETLALLNQYYGVGSSDLITFFLDPEETEAMLQKRYTAARIGTEALRQNFGINVNEAESLATRGIGVGEATQGFQEAAARKAFMSGPGETATREEVLSGTFGQEDTAKKLGRIAGSRTGRFQEGGGFASSAEGVSGLGSSTTR